MAYASITLVRELTGLTTEDVSDDKLNDLIDVAEEIVDLETGKHWSGNEENFKIVQLATAKLAGWLAYRSLAGTEEKTKSFKNEADELLKKLKIQEASFYRG